MSSDYNKRIDKTDKIKMITVAVIFDIIEIILTILVVGLIANRILTLIEYLIYWFWFKAKGVSFTGNAKAASRMGGTFVTEMIPLLGALPGLTYGVNSTIKITRKEDLENSKKTEPLRSGNITRPKRG